MNSAGDEVVGGAWVDVAISYPDWRVVILSEAKDLSAHRERSFGRFASSG